MKINSITPDKQVYLQGLTAIDNVPETLFYIGNLPDSRIKTVAIVGSRKPTHYGKEVAERISRELAQRGIIIISGLALGIDAIAHRACLEAGGKTIAVLGNGLDSIYPSSHKDLAKKILDSGGAILSEYPKGTPALPHHFLARNRLVSGLADAVIVVEAAARSGTLSTATHALNQAKDIFAVPGNITSPLSVGCNNLIKQGAAPLTDTSDILEVIMPQYEQQQTKLLLGDTAEEMLLLQLLQDGVRDGEELLKRSELDANIYSQTLSMLEIKGMIRGLGANRWTLR